VRGPHAAGCAGRILPSARAACCRVRGPHHPRAISAHRLDMRLVFGKWTAASPCSVPLQRPFACSTGLAAAQAWLQQRLGCSTGLAAAQAWLQHRLSCSTGLAAAQAWLPSRTRPHPPASPQKPSGRRPGRAWAASGSLEAPSDGCRWAARRRPRSTTQHPSQELGGALAARHSTLRRS
jgi:hypothetical protein